MGNYCQDEADIARLQKYTKNVWVKNINIKIKSKQKR